jgi:hypothetical protein
LVFKRPPVPSEEMKRLVVLAVLSTARFVVVAFVVVAFTTERLVMEEEANAMRPLWKYESPVEVALDQSRFAKCEVEEANSPFCAQMGEVVAAAVWP